MPVHWSQRRHDALFCTILAKILHCFVFVSLLSCVPLFFCFQASTNKNKQMKGEQNTHLSSVVMWSMFALTYVAYAGLYFTRKVRALAFHDFVLCMCPPNKHCGQSLSSQPLSIIKSTMLNDSSIPLDSGRCGTLQNYIKFILFDNSLLMSPRT